VESLLVVRVNYLGVLDAKTVLGLAFRQVSAVALLLQGRFQCINGVAVGKVSNGMDVHLEASACPRLGEIRKR
jgi:hypothetical protein